MHEQPSGSPRRAKILRALDDLVDAVEPRDVAGTAAAGRAVLAEALQRPAHASAHQVTAVGHAHIDSAWLWPVRETARKCARTFANVLALMAEDQDLVFACSSAQQYAWIRDQYPELFARIRDRVAEGRFVPVGGMWVESDTNMPGGEALVRQFVAGQRFFADGVRRRVPGGLAAGLLRVHRRAAADRPAGRDPLVPDPEDLVERDQPDPPPHLLVGGHRRQPAVHPLPAGRHLQLRPVRARARPRRAPVRREGPGEPLAGALRLG